MANEAKQLLEQLRQQNLPQAKAVLEQLRQQQREPAGVGRAVTQNTAERLVGGLLGVPEFAARAARGGGNVLRAATGNEMIPIPPEGLLGLPSGREAVAGIETGLGLLGQSRTAGPVQGASELFEQNLQRREQVEADQPLASAGGDLLGDALSIMGGRAPFIRSATSGSRTAKTTTDIIAPALKAELNKAFRTRAAEKIAKVAGRSLEAGLEGVAFSILQGGDPIETAALSSGSQVAGLAGLRLAEVAGFGDLIRGRFVKGGAKLGATAFAVGSLIQVLKSSTPGGKDFILESIESGFDKIPLGLALGALSAMTGAGRVKGGQLPAVKANLPTLIMDAFSTIPRANTIDLLRQTTEDESGLSEKTINSIISSPQAFTEGQLNKLNKGIENGNFVDVVKDLFENDDKFQRVISSPHPDLADVPIKEADDE